MAPRLPPIPPEHYGQAQSDAAQDFLQARGTPVFGPFLPLIYSPDLMTLASAMGQFLRYRSGIGNTLSELAILITARNWTQDFEWHVHAPIAAQEGIAPDTIAAIRDGRRPDAMTPDEALVYDFTHELQDTKRVSDTTWARAEARFGKPALVDLVGISGYYTFLAMQLNAARNELPPGAEKLPRLPEA